MRKHQGCCFVQLSVTYEGNCNKMMILLSSSFLLISLLVSDWNHGIVTGTRRRSWGWRLITATGQTRVTAQNPIACPTITTITKQWHPGMWVENALNRVKQVQSEYFLVLWCAGIHWYALVYIQHRFTFSPNTSVSYKSRTSELVESPPFQNPESRIWKFWFGHREDVHSSS